MRIPIHILSWLYMYIIYNKFITKYPNLAKKLADFWSWKERFPWATILTELWRSFGSTFDLFIAGSSVKGTGRWRRYTIFCFRTGTKELQNKSLAGPCIRGAEKLKIDDTHRYPRTGYQWTENKIVRRSALKRLKVMPTESQSAVKKVPQGKRLFTVKIRFFPRFPFSPWWFY